MAEEKKPLWVLMGASGRIGRMLMRHWGLVPPDSLQILAQHRGVGPGLQWSPLDGPKPLIDLALEQGGIQGLIVLSGITPSSKGDLSTNGAIVQAAVAAAHAAGIKRLLVASSSAVYSTGNEMPQTEYAPTLPVNDYGRAKLFSEGVCDRAWEAGVDICSLRIGNVAGADALLLNAECATAAAPLQLDRFSDGRGPQRSYIGPSTLADVFETLACHSGPLPIRLNIAAPNPVSMESLVSEAHAPWHFVRPSSTAYQTITLDCSRLNDLHDFPANASDPAEMIVEWKRLKDTI